MQHPECELDTLHGQVKGEASCTGSNSVFQTCHLQQACILRNFGTQPCGQQVSHCSAQAILYFGGKWSSNLLTWHYSLYRQRLGSTTQMCRTLLGRAGDPRSLWGSPFRIRWMLRRLQTTSKTLLRCALIAKPVTDRASSSVNLDIIRAGEAIPLFCCSLACHNVILEVPLKMQKVLHQAFKKGSMQTGQVLELFGISQLITDENEAEPKGLGFSC